MRLHRIDENVSGDVAPLLAFLRELQRRHAVAIAVVHHARKGAATVRAGQALRGSSEFHAWGDSNLYLRRDTDDRIALTVEHRAAAAIAGITLELAQRDDALALRPVQADPQPNRSVRARFLRSAHHRGSRRRQPATAILRPARVLPRSCHHPLRTPRRHDRRRHRHEIRQWLQPHRSLNHSAPRPAQRIAAIILDITASPNNAAPWHRADATSRFRFPYSLHPTGSGTGKPIKIRDRKAIKQRDRAHLDHARVMRPVAAVRFQAKRSNELWQFDMSPSDLKQVEAPLWIEQGRGKPTLMLFSVVDDRSGVVYDEYRCVYGEDAESALRFLFNAMAPKPEAELPFQGIPTAIYMDNGPVSRSKVFQSVMGSLGVRVLTHMPPSQAERRTPARAKGKVERPFRTIKEVHETLYHFHKPKDEAEASAPGDRQGVGGASPLR